MNGGCGVTIRAAERKTEWRPGLKERGMEAGYSITASRRKARVEV